MKLSEIEDRLSFHRLWLGQHPQGIRGDFRGARIADVDLSNQTFSGARFDGASFRGVRMRQAFACQSSFRGISVEFCDFSGSDFTQSDFAGGSLWYVTANSALFWRCDFAGSTLRNCDLSRSSFDGSKMLGVKFDETAFREATFGGVDAVFASCDGADFRGSLLETGSLRIASGRDVDFRGCDIRRVSFYPPTADVRFIDGPGLYVRRDGRLQRIEVVSSDCHGFGEIRTENGRGFVEAKWLPCGRIRPEGPTPYDLVARAR